MKLRNLSVALSLFAMSCGTTNYTRREPIFYEQAIQEAMYPTARKQQELWSLSKENTNIKRKVIQGEEHILMLTWKAKNYYPESGEYNTGNYEIWVTAAPELYNRIQQLKPKNPELRLKQLLGLPPTAQNKFFIEMWVRPSDLFRPCPDNEVDDTQCNICFTAKDSLKPDYIQWFNTGRLDRYYAAGLYNQYPWTQLGYTYDWHPKNKSHIGLSEFVIGKNKKIYIERVYTTNEYLTSTKK